MIPIKRILSLFLLLCMTLASMLLVGCSQETEEGLLAIQPVYVGETVTDTKHTFKPEDFQVTAIYTGNESKQITDFTLEITELKDGYYTALIAWNGLEEECYVPLEMDIYASDMND